VTKRLLAKHDYGDMQITGITNLIISLYKTEHH